jgi:hypothetical protein
LNNTLSDEQFEFRKNPSMDKALFNCTEETLRALNSKIHGEISCDPDEVSDAVNHKTLLSKLNLYGI